MSSRAIIWLLFFCAGLLCWGVALGAPIASELVRDSLAAPYLWNFSGTQVLINWTPSGTSTSTTLSVAHRKPSTTLARYQNGSGRIVQDDGTYVRQYESRYRVVLVDRRPPTPTPTTLFRLLSRSHRMVLAGTDKVCGRKAFVVLIIPRVPGNPWRKCWIDYYTKLTLKNEQYGSEWPNGQPQSFMFWSSISFQPVTEQAVKLPTIAGAKLVPCPHGQPVVSLGQVQKLLGFRVLMPANPPPGYVYDGASVVQVGTSRAVHLRFTNGLNAVSVFQSSGPIQPQALAQVNTQILIWRQGSVNIALVGNIDKGMLDMLRRQIGDRAEREMLAEVSRMTGDTIDYVARLRDRGYGFRSIAIALLAARTSGQDASALLRLNSYGFSWEELSQRYSFQLREIQQKIRDVSD